MSFKYQGYNITYNDINKYFEDMRISRERYKKTQEELIKKEESKYIETIEIIKNHSKFLLELNEKKLCKYGGNSSIISIFKFNKINNYKNYDNNNYEIVNKDDEGIEEVSNLLSLVIEHKKKKEKDNNKYLNRKINIFMILTGITISYLLIRK